MDWTAFGIAALGIIGTLVSPLIAHKLEKTRQVKADERDDQATLRLKLEETYCEIDRLQGQANLSSIAAIRIARGEEDVPQQSAFDIGRLRANVGLYFPECAEAFKEYDAELENQGRELRNDFEANPVNAMANYTIVSSAIFITLAGKMRNQLDSRAAEIRIATTV